MPQLFLDDIIAGSRPLVMQNQPSVAWLYQLVCSWQGSAHSLRECDSCSQEVLSFCGGCDGGGGVMAALDLLEVIQMLLGSLVK